jgi:uncharacterized protein
MRERIIARLRMLEGQHRVRIVYACESGSRAWGFPSSNSDYDVRFLYIHPVNWYLSVEKRRDVIEEPLVDELDINGWDLKKALGLLYKSNPPLLEWLGSPIVYMEAVAVVRGIRAILPQFYSSANCFAHYYHMAKANFREYLKGDIVRTKKYFYVLRPVLAMQWIERAKGVVPTDFNVLVAELITDPTLLADIETLLEQKRAGAELQAGPRINSVSSFIESEMERFSGFSCDKTERGSIDTLDSIFRQSLDACWGETRKN